MCCVASKLVQMDAIICFMNGQNKTRHRTEPSAFLIAKAMGMMPGATGQMVAPVDPNARWLADLQYPCSVLFCLQLNKQAADAGVLALKLCLHVMAKLWELLAALFFQAEGRRQESWTNPKP